MLLCPSAEQLGQLHQIGVLPHSVEKASAIAAFEQGSPEWHQERRLRLGASEVAIIGAPDALQTRAQLIEGRRNGPAQPSAAMQRGSRLESSIAQQFAAHMQASLLPLRRVVHDAAK